MHVHAMKRERQRDRIEKRKKTIAELVESAESVGISDCGYMCFKCGWCYCTSIEKTVSIDVPENNAIESRR